MIGAIIAGGANSRFGGEPKGLRLVGGRRIIDRVADALRPVVDDVILVANAFDAPTWLDGVRVQSDTVAAHGSLVGLHSALTAAAGDDVLLVAWDMPFVTRELLQLVKSRLSTPIYAAVPESSHGLEPFCAAYSSRCLRFVEQRVEEGSLRVGSLIDALPVVRRIGVGELAEVGDPTRLFFNVNSEADLAVAETMAREE